MEMISNTNQIILVNEAILKITIIILNNYVIIIVFRDFLNNYIGFSCNEVSNV